MRCNQVEPTEASPSTGRRSAFSLTSENSLPNAPVVWNAMAIIAATGPPPSTKMSTSAITTSGTARMMSMARRKSGISNGQRARPRVASTERTDARIVPSSVEAAAILMFSSSDGK